MEGVDLEALEAEQPGENEKVGELLTDKDLRHIVGRLVRAMDAIKIMQQLNLLRQMPTQEQLSHVNISVYKSAADVGPLVKEVEILRRTIASMVDYATETMKSDNPDEVLVASMFVSFAKMEMENLMAPKQDESNG